MCKVGVSTKDTLNTMVPYLIQTTYPISYMNFQSHYKHNDIKITWIISKSNFYRNVQSQKSHLGPSSHIDSLNVDSVHMKPKVHHL
jgi:hypothetical protein